MQHQIVTVVAFIFHKSSVKNVVKLFSITARVYFLKPKNAKDFDNRKIMTLSLQNIIGESYSRKINDKKI